MVRSDRRTLKARHLDMFRNYSATMFLFPESYGCSVAVKLHNFKDHVAQCKYNPNLMVFCDKGCGLQMTFKDYQNANCIIHLANLVTAQQKQIEFLMKTRKIWQKVSGFKIRNSDQTLLRHVNGKQLSFAQSSQS